MNRQDAFQALLDDVSTAYETGEFELWEKRVILPFTIHTDVSQHVLETTDELRDNFERFYEGLQTYNADTVFRRSLFLGESQNGMSLGMFETETLCRGQRVLQPYTTAALIKELPEGWRMSMNLRVLGHLMDGGKLPSIMGWTKND